MADSLASPVRVQFNEDEDIYTRKRTFTSVHAKRSKTKTTVLPQKGFKVDIILWVLHNDWSVVHLVINNGHCGKTSKGLLRLYTRRKNGTFWSCKINSNVPLVVSTRKAFFNSHWCPLNAWIATFLYTIPNIYQLSWRLSISLVLWNIFILQQSLSRISNPKSSTFTFLLPSEELNQWELRLNDQSLYYGASRFQTLHGILCDDIYIYALRLTSALHLSKKQTQNSGRIDVQEQGEKWLLVHLPGWILALYCFNTPWNTRKKKNIKARRKTKLWKTIERKRRQYLKQAQLKKRGWGQIFIINAFVRGLSSILLYLVLYFKKTQSEREDWRVCTDWD